jgi:hypothetical protein
MLRIELLKDFIVVSKLKWITKVSRFARPHKVILSILESRRDSAAMPVRPRRGGAGAVTMRSAARSPIQKARVIDHVFQAILERAMWMRLVFDCLAAHE